jgi:hypothetical protein
MKIDYFVILTASLNNAILVLNLSKKQRLVPLTTLNIWVFKRYENCYIAILTASLNKAVFVLNLSKKQRLVPLTT